MLSGSQWVLPVFMAWGQVSSERTLQLCVLQEQGWQGHPGEPDGKDLGLGNHPCWLASFISTLALVICPSVTSSAYRRVNAINSKDFSKKQCPARSTRHLTTPMEQGHGEWVSVWSSDPAPHGAAQAVPQHAVMPFCQRHSEVIHVLAPTQCKSVFMLEIIHFIEVCCILVS